MRNCIVACYDEEMENLVVQNVRELNPGMEIMTVRTEMELVRKLCCSGNVIIYFDKFFLGYVIKYKLIEYKIINPHANIVFVEKGECPISFGLRLYSIGVNSFICNLENQDMVKDPFLRTFENLSYYPEEVLHSIRNNEHILERRCCSEITGIELNIAMNIGLGKSLKEIGYLNNSNYRTISSQINRLKKKIGYKSPSDLINLNKRIMFYDRTEM